MKPGSMCLGLNCSFVLPVLFLFLWTAFPLPTLTQSSKLGELRVVTLGICLSSFKNCDKYLNSI